MIFGCATTQQKTYAIATQKYGNQFSLVPNSTNEYFLCIQKQKERIAVQPIQFFVYSSDKDSIVYERELDNGTVHWLNASQLSIQRVPGNITGDEGPDAFTEIYDVVTGTISIPKIPADR